MHGAILDARLLADVYLAMTRGQESLIIEEGVLGKNTILFQNSDIITKQIFVRKHPQTRKWFTSSTWKS